MIQTIRGTDDVLRRELHDRRNVFGADRAPAPANVERKIDRMSGPVVFIPVEVT